MNVADPFEGIVFGFVVEVRTVPVDTLSSLNVSELPERKLDTVPLSTASSDVMVVGDVNDMEGAFTVTIELTVDSAPIQFPLRGATVYLHVPAGTLLSVHDRVATYTSHALLMA